MEAWLSALKTHVSGRNTVLNNASGGSEGPPEVCVWCGGGGGDLLSHTGWRQHGTEREQAMLVSATYRVQPENKPRCALLCILGRLRRALHCRRSPDVGVWPRQMLMGLTRRCAGVQSGDH